jgi:hypothetical protein
MDKNEQRESETPERLAPPAIAHKLIFFLVTPARHSVLVSLVLRNRVLFSLLFKDCKRQQ